MTFVKQEFLDYIDIDVVESHPEWVDGTSISAYDIVVHNKYLWKAVIDNPVDEPTDKSVQWVKWGISNKYAAIDDKSHTSTTKDGGDIVMSFKWVGYDSLVIGSAIASDIDIKISAHTDPNFLNPLWQTSINSLARSCVTGWYKYFNVDRSCPVNHLESDTIDAYIKTPPNLLGNIQITLHQSSVAQLTSVGMVLGGMGYYAGCTMFPVGLGIEDFSKYETDEWGTTKLVKRDNRKKRLFRTWVKKIDILRIEEYVTRNLMGQSLLIVGDEDDTSQYNNMLIMGHLDGFDVTMEHYAMQAIEFNVKEMI